MKNRVVVAIFVAVFSFGFCEAQILIGPTAGAQLSWVSLGEKENKDFYRIKPSWGFHAGLGLSFRVRKRFFLTSSFLYSTKGKRVEGLADKLLSHEVVYKFIDVPIIYSVDFRAKLGDGNEFKYFLGIGPNISYWLGAKGKLYNTDFHENQFPEMEFKAVFGKDESEVVENEMAVMRANRIQLGLNLAAGVVLEPIPFQKFMFVVRYEFGHSYFSNENDGYFANTTYQDDLKSRNQGVRVSLFYMVDMRVEERKKGKSTIRPERRRRR